MTYNVFGGTISLTHQSINLGSFFLPIFAAVRKTYNTVIQKRCSKETTFQATEDYSFDVCQVPDVFYEVNITLSHSDRYVSTTIAPQRT